MLTKESPCLSMVSNKSIPCKANSEDMTDLVEWRIFLVVAKRDCLDNKSLRELNGENDSEENGFKIWI